MNLLISLTVIQITKHISVFVHQLCSLPSLSADCLRVTDDAFCLADDRDAL